MRFRLLPETLFLAVNIIDRFLTKRVVSLVKLQLVGVTAMFIAAKYEEIVGPVIEEYEKTISAMEAELKLNRAALRHTNDLYDEKDSEYNALAERHATTEMYVEELKTRVAKLAEREASTEVSECMRVRKGK